MCSRGSAAVATGCLALRVAMRNKICSYLACAAVCACVPISSCASPHAAICYSCTSSACGELTSWLHARKGAAAAPAAVGAASARSLLQCVALHRVPGQPALCLHDQYAGSIWRNGAASGITHALLMSAWRVQPHPSALLLLLAFSSLLSSSLLFTLLLRAARERVPQEGASSRQRRAQRPRAGTLWDLRRLSPPRRARIAALQP